MEKQTWQSVAYLWGKSLSPKSFVFKTKNLTLNIFFEAKDNINYFFFLSFR